MYSDKIDDVFLRHAADIIADTNTGLTGSEIVKFCNTYAIDFNVNIPITSSNFGSFGSVVPNKRTALYKNLVAFNACQQFKIIKELSELDKFANNEDVKKLKVQLYERFGRFDISETPSKESTTPQTADVIAEVLKVLLDMYNNDDEMYLVDGDARLSHIKNYEKVLNRMKAQGYFTKLSSDVLGGYEVELSEKCFTYSQNKDVIVDSVVDQPKKDLPSVFVSYNHGSSDFVDKIEKSLAGICNIKRDKNEIGDWESISDFMKTIRKEDFAVLVISDSYLKSTACLFEVIQLMKDENWDKHTMYVIMDDAKTLYNLGGQLDYIQYWENHYKDIYKKIEQLPLESAHKQIEQLNKITTIKKEIGEFLNKVSDANNPSTDEVISRIKHRINPALF